MGIAFGTFVEAVRGEHALEADGYAFDVLDGGPALGAEEIEADYTVGVDVRVHGDWTVGGLHKRDFWRLC